MTINKVMVVGGGGQMGNGIGQVAAVAGLEVTLVDLSRDDLQRVLGRIEKSLERLVRKGELCDSDAQAARDRITVSTDLEGTAAGTDHAIESIVQDLDLKQEIFRDRKSTRLNSSHVAISYSV